jgi:hypothetical protein
MFANMAFAGVAASCIAQGSEVEDAASDLTSESTQASTSVSTSGMESSADVDSSSSTMQSTSEACGNEEVRCDGTCIDPASDLKHCGARGSCMGDERGEACADGWACVDARCDPRCSQGWLRCDGSCIDPSYDANFCGATNRCEGGDQGTNCKFNEVCWNGTCVNGFTWENEQTIFQSFSDAVQDLNVVCGEKGSVAVTFKRGENRHLRATRSTFSGWEEHDAWIAPWRSATTIDWYLPRANQLTAIALHEGQVWRIEIDLSDGEKDRQPRLQKRLLSDPLAFDAALLGSDDRGNENWVATWYAHSKWWRVHGQSADSALAVVVPFNETSSEGPRSSVAPSGDVLTSWLTSRGSIVAHERYSHFGGSAWNIYGPFDGHPAAGLQTPVFLRDDLGLAIWPRHSDASVWAAAFGATSGWSAPLRLDSPVPTATEVEWKIGFAADRRIGVVAGFKGENGKKVIEWIAREDDGWHLPHQTPIAQASDGSNLGVFVHESGQSLFAWQEIRGEEHVLLAMGLGLDSDTIFVPPTPIVATDEIAGAIFVCASEAGRYRAIWQQRDGNEWRIKSALTSFEVREGLY